MHALYIYQCESGSNCVANAYNQTPSEFRTDRSTFKALNSILFNFEIQMYHYDDHGSNSLVIQLKLLVMVHYSGSNIHQELLIQWLWYSEGTSSVAYTKASAEVIGTIGSNFTSWTPIPVVRCHGHICLPILMRLAPSKKSGVKLTLT